MTAKTLSEVCGFKPIALPDSDREIKGVYIGDLLSWVMGRAESGNAWLTIMSNVNILAVATLCDVGTIILTEGVQPSLDIIATANEKGINIISTEMPSYECACKLAGLL